MGNELTMPMTIAEEADLERLERIIEIGRKSFIEVGLALMKIRDSQLYRIGHKTFEEYCKEKWGFVRRQAGRLIQAAVIGENLRPIGLKPSTESQTRPLTSLEPEQQQEVWQKAVETAPEGN